MQINDERLADTVVRRDVTYQALERTIYYLYEFPNGNVLDATGNKRLFHPFYP
jgi:hypothetical protein